uniref:D-aminoacyl-tRNA deacylase n=1 Tax=Xiphophorus couchianus TaxID=32473 RepID=A0A3B5LAK6_9TELE
MISLCLHADLKRARTCRANKPSSRSSLVFSPHALFVAGTSACLHTVSVLDLPGSVLLVPQDSLVGEPLVNRRMQYKDRCEPWLGAQLFSSLVGACRQLMSESAKCTKEGMKVEHGAYGQKQEISIRSLEPLSLLLEF